MYLMIKRQELPRQHHLQGGWVAGAELSAILDRIYAKPQCEWTDEDARIIAMVQQALTS